MAPLDRLHTSRITVFYQSVSIIHVSYVFQKITSCLSTRNAWQSPAYSPPGAAVSPPSE